MSINVTTSFDEHDIAEAIKAGDLSLDEILIAALDSDETTYRLASQVVSLGGTKDAGRRARLFGDAMLRAPEVAF